MGTTIPGYGLICSGYQLSPGSNLKLQGLLLRPNQVFGMQNDSVSAGGSAVAMGYYQNINTGAKTRFSFGLDMADLVEYGWWDLVTTDQDNVAVFNLTVQAKGDALTFSAGIDADETTTEFTDPIPENGFIRYQKELVESVGSHSLHVITGIVLSGNCGLYVKKESGSNFSVVATCHERGLDDSGSSTSVFGRVMSGSGWWEIVYPNDTMDRFVTIFVRGSTSGASTYSLVVSAATPTDGSGGGGGGS
jgi:hypothetical protein